MRAESPQKVLRNAASQLAAIPVVREPHTVPDTPPPDLKNWDHAAQLFEANGVSREEVLKIFSDPRMPERQELLFSLEPKESSYNYRKLNKPLNRKNALAFYAANSQYFKKAAQEYPVPESVILAILQVETACGRIVGSQPVLPALLRLALANAPDNVERNIEWRRAEDDAQTIAKIKTRAAELENIFLPHAIAVLPVARNRGIDPFDLRGSGAGAIGFPQFLPGHVLTYGVDADRDGFVDIFSGPDAILSVAKYLHAHGWSATKMPVKSQRKAIWEYNRSQPYIDTVLGMASMLAPDIERIKKGKEPLPASKERKPSRKT